MTYGREDGQPSREGPQADRPWQPPRYDPALHHQRLGQQYPSQDQYGPQPTQPQGQYQQQPGYGPQAAAYGQSYPQITAAAGKPPKKKRRVFLWVFLIIQALFIIWIITGVASNPGGPSTAVQAAHQCANGGWQGLFKSQADCQVHYAHALNDATDAGKGIGVALIVVFWCVVDFLTGITYLIYRLARRR
ncbi:MAG TPA: hypothetical protein VG164_12260 [Trebonia sp.]|jgi:hypothetical protein|nr:hypothetical protein [Trebonia sp.]